MPILGDYSFILYFCLQKYSTMIIGRNKEQQGEDGLKEANGDFTKYWLNGEVLIVRMVDGKLVAETH